LTVSALVAARYWWRASSMNASAAASRTPERHLGLGVGVLVVVDKIREIYFIDNVKFHIDVVEGIGSFIEIESIDTNATIGKQKLLDQCGQYLVLFGINESD
jgi:adenylate cyclase, class 2